MHDLMPSFSLLLTDPLVPTLQELEELPFMLPLAFPSLSSWHLVAGHPKLGRFTSRITPPFVQLSSLPLSAIITILLPQLLTHLLTTPTPLHSSTTLYSPFLASAIYL